MCDKILEVDCKFLPMQKEINPEVEKSASIIGLETNLCFYILFFLCEILIWEGGERATK